mgnify:CR=1 FL=1
MKSRIKYKVHSLLINESIKELFREIDELNSCDCCQYMDMDIERFGGMEYPIYYPLEKGEQHHFKTINPRQYIYAIARGFGGLSYEDAIAHVNMDTVKKYAQDMKNGDKFPIGYYNEGGDGQEGRHRALALMELGCENMPVIVISKLSENQQREFALKYKDMSPEDLNRTFQSMGYDGVKSLDINSLTNYVKYRL